MTWFDGSAALIIPPAASRLVPLPNSVVPVRLTVPPASARIPEALVLIVLFSTATVAVCPAVGATLIAGPHPLRITVFWTMTLGSDVLGVARIAEFVA